MITAAYRFHSDFPTILKSMNKTYQNARKDLIKAQERQQWYADRKQQELLLKEGDQVMLKSDDYHSVLLGNTKKLYPRYLGPYRALKKINDNAYKIDPPRSLEEEQS